MAKLSETHPELAQLWSPKNKRSFYDFDEDFKHEAIWICPESGAEYRCRINRRLKHGALSSPFISNRKLLSGFNDLATKHPELCELWSPNNKLSPSEVLGSTGKKYLWICPETGSEYERSVKSQVKAGRKSPFYWHSEQRGRDKWYHYKKHEKCREKGVSLVTVWEDDWIHRNNGVKNHLFSLITSNEQKTLSAYSPSVVIKDISDEEAQDFIENHHPVAIDLKDCSFISLFDNEKNETILVGAVRKHDDGVEIVCCCSSCELKGGFDKFISILKFTKPPHAIIRYTVSNDLGVSDKLLSAGFAIEKHLEPEANYTDVSKKTRISGRELKDFLAANPTRNKNNLQKVWDSGRTTYILQ